MNTLTEFLRQQKKADKPEGLTKRKKEWSNALKALFQQINTWLADAKKEKLVNVKEGEIQITEKALGTYKAPYMTLNFTSKFDKKIVEIRPVGSMIIGADGRVDMVSPKGTYLFLFVASTNKWVHGSGKQPVDFPELTEELFTELLKRSLA